MKNLIPLTLAVLSAPAWCQPCSNADLRGVYSFQSSGHVNLKDLGPGLPDLVAPLAVLGFLEYDGKGDASGRVTGTWGGMPATFDTTDMKYSVNTDCTAAIEIRLKHVETGQPVGPDQHTCVVLEDGNLIRCLMVEAAGRTITNSTEMRRLNRGRRVCDASMIRGSYGVHYDGWFNVKALNPSLPMQFAPASGVGIGNIDLSAGSTGAAVHIYAGTRIDTEMTSLSIVVNPDCTGLMEALVRNKTMGGGFTYKSPIIVLNNGDRFIALNVEAPAFVYYNRVGME